MRKTRTKTVSQKVTETVDVLCNKCGESLNNGKRYWNDKQWTCFEGLEEVEIHGGYHSKFIGDMCSLRFSLCEECIVDLTKTFKIPAEIKTEFTGEFVTPDQFKKLEKKHHDLNLKQWVKAISEISKELKVKVNKNELKTKTDRELYDLYHELQKQKRALKKD